MAQNRVTYRGRSYPVLDELRLGRRHYLIVERLGGNKLLRVFDRDAGREGEFRAIRVVPRSAHSQQIVGVLRRIATMSSNLPSILEYHPKGDVIYLVLPWIQGQGLDTYLKPETDKRCPRIGAREALRLVRGLAHGISTLHQRKNIVHGDLKPANLIVCWEPSRLVPIDFGSAWMVEQSTSRGLGDGGGRTDCYASPEQLLISHPDVRERPLVDFRSDYFSISVILYQLLTLKIPYGRLGGGAGLPEHRGTVVTYVPPSQASKRMEALPPSVRRKVDRLVTKGLSLDVSRRFESRKSWLAAFDDIDLDLRRTTELTWGNRLFLRLWDLLPLNRFINWLSQDLQEHV